MEQPQREVYEFPTWIPLKVIGRNEDEFEQYVVSLFRGQLLEEEIDAVTSRTSRGDTYLSVTVTVLARSREHLDTLYQELALNKRVMMVL